MPVSRDAPHQAVEAEEVASGGNRRDGPAVETDMLTKATTTLVSLALSLALGACGRGEVTQAGSTGSTGCNAMGGKSAVHDHTSTITFSEVITTKMACDDDRMRVERAVLGTLDDDVAYRVEADVLRLDGPDGHGLRLRAAE